MFGQTQLRQHHRLSDRLSEDNIRVLKGLSRLIEDDLARQYEDYIKVLNFYLPEIVKSTLGFEPFGQFS